MSGIFIAIGIVIVAGIIVYALARIIDPSPTRDDRSRGGHDF